jgi:hypothetical protein
MAAAMLGYIAHYNFGLSRLEIRIPAVVGAVIIAAVIATLVAIDFFSRRLRKPWPHSGKLAAPLSGWYGVDRPA